MMYFFVFGLGFSLAAVLPLLPLISKRVESDEIAMLRALERHYRHEGDRLA